MRIRALPWFLALLSASASPTWAQASPNITLRRGTCRFLAARMIYKHGNTATDEVIASSVLDNAVKMADAGGAGHVLVYFNEQANPKFQIVVPAFAIKGTEKQLFSFLVTDLKKVLYKKDGSLSLSPVIAFACMDSGDSSNNRKPMLSIVLSGDDSLRNRPDKGFPFADYGDTADPCHDPKANFNPGDHWKTLKPSGDCADLKRFNKYHLSFDHERPAPSKADYPADWYLEHTNDPWPPLQEASHGAKDSAPPAQSEPHSKAKAAPRSR